MKTKQNLTIAIMALLAIALMTTGTLAKDKKGPPTECGLAGTWMGVPDGPLVWSAIHTADPGGMSGTMQLNWVFVGTELLTWYSKYDVTHLSPGNGVWKKTGPDQYDYTWYAFGIGIDGSPAYSLRVSGKATITNCDNVDITYVYELFDPPVFPWEMTGDAKWGTSGTGVEIRLPLVTPSMP